MEVKVLFTWNDNKHLMTGPKGNSQFCFPKTFNVSQVEGYVAIVSNSFQTCIQA